MSLASPIVKDDVDLNDMLEAAIPPPVCEWQGRDDPAQCGAPAVWLVSFSCGHSYYYDAPHGEHMKRTLDAPGINLCDNPSPPRHRSMIPITAAWSPVS